MKKLIPFIIVFTLVLSCTSNTIYEKPDNLIEKNLMIELITQMQIANGARSSKNKNGVRKIEYMSLVYKRFGIDSAQFAESNLYYSSNIDEYADIFQEVKRVLETLEKDQEVKEIIRDSLENIKREEIRKKSIKDNKKELLQPRGVYQDKE